MGFSVFESTCKKGFQINDVDGENQWDLGELQSRLSLRHNLDSRAIRHNLKRE